MALTLLIIGAEADSTEPLGGQLTAFGHSLVMVRNGPQALAAVRDDAFDGIILDRIMPVMDGIAMLRHLRANGVRLPVMILAETGTTAQRVEGLEAGADDYAVELTDPLELNARLRALVRGRQWSIAGEEDTIRAGAIVVSPTKYRAWRDGRPLDLPRTELRLLTELARHAGTVLTRPVLLQRVWNYDSEPTTNIVDTYIKRLRKKLTEGGGDDPIATLRGVGYMLRA